jgi:hypothetical protein
MLLIEKLPELAQELEQLLRKHGDPDLAEQVPTLEIVNRCRCEDDFCSSVCTKPEPKGPYGKGHQTLLLDPERGMLLVDVVDRQIAFVEVLYRDDIRKALLEVLP